jgi:hypothetical protein
MKGKLQRVVPFLAIVTGGVAMLAPSAAATGHTSQSDPGQVPAKLGSPDPREPSRAGVFAGLVPTLLGSQDPRDTARVGPTAALANVAIPQYSARAGYAPSVVASRLGSPDPRDAAALTHRSIEIGSEAYRGDVMFRDYFRGTHWSTGR